MNLSDPIGGYLEWHLNPGKIYYPGMIAVNSGRNAFECILEARKYKRVYIPYFTCDVLLEPLARQGIKYEFYHIDENLEPAQVPDLREAEAFLYTNYFGIKTECVKELAQKVKALIVDNSQAFFDAPLSGIDTFYSPRKFFGIPDGGYVSLPAHLVPDYDRDISFERCGHLLCRIDKGAEAGYEIFKSNDKALSGLPIRKMSLLTESHLTQVDYDWAAKQRRSNFNHLHEMLSGINELHIPGNMHAPMVYPLLVKGKQLKQRLLDAKIFVATYWPNVLDWASGDTTEVYLTNNLVPLPVDHRYDHQHMLRMANIILS